MRFISFTRNMAMAHRWCTTISSCRALSRLMSGVGMVMLWSAVSKLLMRCITPSPNSEALCAFRPFTHSCRSSTMRLPVRGASATHTLPFALLGRRLLSANCHPVTGRAPLITASPPCRQQITVGDSGVPLSSGLTYSGLSIRYTPASSMMLMPPCTRASSNRRHSRAIFSARCTVRSGVAAVPSAWSLPCVADTWMSPAHAAWVVAPMSSTPIKRCLTFIVQ